MLAGLSCCEPLSDLAEEDNAANMTEALLILTDGQLEELSTYGKAPKETRAQLEEIAREHRAIAKRYRQPL